MARRKKHESLLEVVVELASRLPWWLGVIAAGLLYWLLHWIADRPMPVPTGSGPPRSPGDLVWHSVIHAFALYGQYLVPALCLLGAAISLVHRLRGSQLVQSAVTANSVADALHGMNWRQFEQLVAEGFSRQGYQVERTGRAGPDGGVDVELRRGGELHLVQCKQWRARRVGVEVVRQLYGVMTARGAASGFVVSAGEFTPEATQFASGRNLRLITGAELHRLLKQEHEAAVTPATPASKTRSVFAMRAAPSCPVCGAGMTLRTSQRGAYAGRHFWGCTDFPACRGLRGVND